LSAELMAPLYEPVHVLDPLSTDAVLHDTQAKSEVSALVGADERSVPPFIVADSQGRTWSSAQVLGTRAVMLVFFASFCELCGQKLGMVRRALSKVDGADVLWVAVDDDKTRSHVPGFLREQRLPNAAYVMGAEYPDFLRRYNPTHTLPLVVVVGKSGKMVDYQAGLGQDDGPRLEAAWRFAQLH
jgi:hypothetical protein